MLSLLFREPLIFFVWVLAIVVALSVHEFSHALVGFWLGDETAKRLGRLTLNPVAHVDPVGFFTLLLVGFGWGRPVPYNPYNLRNQKWGPVLIALAGPITNLLLAIVFGTVFRILAPRLSADNLLIQFLLLAVFLNIGLFLFNLIPLPPLDGSKILLTALHRPATEHIRIFLETRGPLLLLALVAVDIMFSVHIFSGLSFVTRQIVGVLIGGSV